MLERRLCLLDHRHRLLRLDHDHCEPGQPEPVRLGAAVVRCLVLSPSSGLVNVLLIDAMYAEAMGKAFKGLGLRYRYMHGTGF